MVKSLAALSLTKLSAALFRCINELCQDPSISDKPCRLVRGYFSHASASVLESLLSTIHSNFRLSSWETVWAVVLVLRTDVCRLRLKCVSNKNSNFALYEAIGHLGWGLKTVDLRDAPPIEKCDLGIIETFNRVQTLALRTSVLEDLLTAVGTHCENIHILIVHSKSKCTCTGLKSLCSELVCRSLRLLEISAPSELTQQDLHSLLCSLNKIVSLKVETDINFDQMGTSNNLGSVLQPLRKLRYMKLSGASCYALEQLCLFCPEIVKLSLQNPCPGALISLTKCKSLKIMQLCGFDTQEFICFLRAFEGMIECLQLSNGSNGSFNLVDLVKFSSSIQSFQAKNIECYANGPLLLPQLCLFEKKDDFVKFSGVSTLKEFFWGAPNLETIIYDCEKFLGTRDFHLVPENRIKFLLLRNELSLDKNIILEILKKSPFLKELGYFRYWNVSFGELMELSYYVSESNFDLKLIW